MSATYTKLRDGSWGIRVTGQTVQPHDFVAVKTKAGAVKTECVKKVLWQGDGVTLCAIGARRSAAAPTYRCKRRYGCDECGEWVTEDDGTTCWETGAKH